MTQKRYRECMIEIEAIMKKYDMGGAINIVSEDRAMFKYFWPTWGCIRWEGNAIRFRAKREDFPDEATQMRTMELSVHILLQMKDMAAQTFNMCEHIEKKLREVLEIDHKSFADFDPETTH